MSHIKPHTILRRILHDATKQPKPVQIHKRLASTSTSTSTSTIPPLLNTATTSTNPPRPFHHRYRRAILWSSTSLALGLTLGILVSHTISPPPHPLPSTHEDQILMHDLSTRIDSEFKVKVLRGKCTAAGAALRGADGSWRELERKPHAAPIFETALSGARALGVERVFWNEKGKELVAVVWFGGATSGWPGVTHGGCIATVMAEKMGLAARLAKNGVDAEEGEETAARSHEELRQLEIQYKKPTYANAFYVVRMLPAETGEGVFASDEVEVAGTLETLEGRLCVAVSGFVPVKGVQAATGTASSAASKAKSWIGWPSRSDATQG